MDVLKVSFERKCDFVNFIHRKGDPDIRGISERVQGAKSYIEIYTENNIKSRLSEYIAEFISVKLRIFLADKHITDNYPYFSLAEKDEILKSLPPDRNTDKIRKTVFEYLSENDSIDITGFVRFRLPDFMRNITADTDRAADIFFVARFYYDSIDILKIHLNKRLSKGMANVIFINSESFIITDENGNHVKLSDETADGSERAEVLLGILLRISPEKVIIHNDFFADPELINILKMVFGDRISICKGCGNCMLDKNNKS